MEFSGLPQCSFPRLLILQLVLQSGATSAIDKTCARFIESHPTIEALRWYPIGGITLSPGTLPALKRLSSTHDFVLAFLLDQTVPRAIECLDGLFLNPDILRTLEIVDGSSMRKLRVAGYHCLRTLRGLMDVFPALTWLYLPPYGIVQDGSYLFVGCVLSNS